MNAVKLTFADILKIEGNMEHYHIPKYQREYVWGRNHWETLLNDIIENDPDYFIGSVIVVNHSDNLRPGEEKIYQVIDGQQRLTTLSIFLAAIYFRYEELYKEFDEYEEEKRDITIKQDSIRKKLVKKKNEVYKDEAGSFKDGKYTCFLRVQPSTQNKNLDDYKYIFYDCGILQNAKQPKFYGNRRFWKAYNYFYYELPESKEDLDELLDKINRLIFIHISVGSQADAFTLFETLNNRGVPLSPIDIIKNSLLAEMEKQHKQDIDETYDQWQDLLSFIPDFDNQIRFLRQYYNAFKVDPKVKHEKISTATRSNILQIYERLIKKDVQFTLNEFLSKGKTYGKFIGITEETRIGTSDLLAELHRVEAAASYTLLLFLFSNEQHLENETTLEEILEFLIKYYVRRNITDSPNTRDLDAINIDIVEKCAEKINNSEKISAQDIIYWQLNSPKGQPSSLEDFKGWLEDDIFINNAGMTRYLLWKLDSISHNREYSPDLWKRNPNNDNYIWTIEHVLPQGQKIPNDWVKMLAKGDKEEAQAIQYKWVHKLGNLTLSAYNSNLSNKSFFEKQSKSHKNVLGEDLYIGYKNGLSLNNLTFKVDGIDHSLAKINYWNHDAIEARTKCMVNKIVEIFAFDREFEKVL